MRRVRGAILHAPDVESKGLGSQERLVGDFFFIIPKGIWVDLQGNDVVWVRVFCNPGLNSDVGLMGCKIIGQGDNAQPKQTNTQVALFLHGEVVVRSVLPRGCE